MHMTENYLRIIACRYSIMLDMLLLIAYISKYLVS